MSRLFLLPALCLALPGCLAKTAVDVVTLPVKVVGAGVDAVTTSQEEADRNLGRKIRKQREREAKEQRRREREERERAEEAGEDDPREER